jgi:diacylglycerol kinase (ATP)
MVNIIDTKEELFLIKRARSVVHASRGIYVFLKTTPNAWFQIFAYLIAIGLGFFFHVTKTEWLFLIMAGGLVIVAECINTAIEIDIDLTSPEYHPYAKDTKDVSAGAVLLTAILAGVICLFIFLPYLANYF